MSTLLSFISMAVLILLLCRSLRKVEQLRSYRHSVGNSPQKVLYILQLLLLLSLLLSLVEGSVTNSFYVYCGCQLICRFEENV